MNILVTGGAGFIGSAFIRYLINETKNQVINVDKLTYAGNLDSLHSIAKSPRYSFVQADIGDLDKMNEVFACFQPDKVIHLAAESHVDRSINDPSAFIQTNIVGTYVLLEVARTYWQHLSAPQKEAFRFHHVSTDEVFGDLGRGEHPFKETTPYAPSSPYSVSKASADHLVRAWHRTYGLPVLITNCSNNYGPYQFPEKLIPCTIQNALSQKPISVYGDGSQTRDWLYVEDHVHALYHVLLNGVIGETYLIGGHNELPNLEVVQRICSILDEVLGGPMGALASFTELISFAPDRPGHDRRYAIDASKIYKELKWKPKEAFSNGIRKTINWYLRHQDWVKTVQVGK